jgi:hypothetical protein
MLPRMWPMNVPFALNLSTMRIIAAFNAIIASSKREQAAISGISMNGKV